MVVLIDVVVVVAGVVVVVVVGVGVATGRRAVTAGTIGDVAR